MDVVSLFSGCGGLDLGFYQAGFDFVWANDNDKFAVKTYQANFDHPILREDINQVNLNEIPRHDVLLAGFPCQPFSMMGEERGFEDTRGTLFFRIVQVVQNQIARGHQPQVLVLENVRTLRTHDRGRTFQVICRVLEHVLGYRLFSAVLNSADFGVPQNRNRTFLVAFLDHQVEYHMPSPVPLGRTMQDLLEERVDQKYFLTERILKTILASGTKNYWAKSEIDLPVARPLTATMAKMHRACQDNYVTQEGRIRRLTPRECARLQGFPEEFCLPVSDTQAYRQMGNAVTVPVALAVARAVKAALGIELEERLLRR
jgi:DNA (cytosine-5)-methyltransferase 1